MPRLASQNTQMLGTESGVVKNSEVFDSSHFLTRSSGVLKKTANAENIVGLSQTKISASANNESTVKARANYLPVNDLTKFLIPVAGETITFSANFVTGNVINFKINGVSASVTNFTTDNATTIAALATKIASEFSSVVYAASAAGNVITVTPRDANSTVTISSIVVTGGASQPTAVVAELTIVQADVGKFYGLATGGQAAIYTSAHASTGKVQLIDIHEDGRTGIFKVANL